VYLGIVAIDLGCSFAALFVLVIVWLVELLLFVDVDDGVAPRVDGIVVAGVDALLLLLVAPAKLNPADGEAAVVLLPPPAAAGGGAGAAVGDTDV